MLMRKRGYVTSFAYAICLKSNSFGRKRNNVLFKLFCNQFASKIMLQSINERIKLVVDFAQICR